VICILRRGAPAEPQSRVPSCTDAVKCYADKLCSVGTTSQDTLQMPGVVVVVCVHVHRQGGKNAPMSKITCQHLRSWSVCSLMLVSSICCLLRAV
jgi:UDP-2,3-diacylglucosamine pyrophosphatase LpxH